LHCNIYLISDYDPGKPTFKGTAIKFIYNGRRTGFDVAGEGEITWNQRSIDVRESGITIDGKMVKHGAKSVTISADGSFSEDQISTVY